MSLTKVLHDSILDSKFCIKEVAKHIDKPYHTLMSELSRQERHKLGCEFVLPIMQLIDDYSAMNYMARELGGAFIIYPKTRRNEDVLFDKIHFSLVNSIKEFSDFASVAAEDIKDGIISTAELERIKKEGQEAVNAITLLIDLANEAHKEVYGKAIKTKTTLAATKAVNESRIGL